MDKRTRQFNEELASLIGIQNIELQYSINRISREAMGIVSRRMRFATSYEQINKAYDVKYNIDIIYSEIQTFIEKKSERLMELYLFRERQQFQFSKGQLTSLEVGLTLPHQRLHL
jgi:hypothetical protein